jgi:hypothetical protein
MPNTQPPRAFDTCFVLYPDDYFFDQVMNVTTVVPSSSFWTVTVSVTASSLGAEGSEVGTTKPSPEEGVQMHGGIGMTDEYDIGLYMKRDRVLNELFGDPAYHADKLARMKGY